MATRMFVCESVEHPSSLLSGLNQQRLKGVLCDITVRVEGHGFKAHINVLASAMGYFRDLFSKYPKDKCHTVDIPMIVNSTGFGKILDFIYTSQLCLSQSSVMQVLCSACYLQIPYVVEKCQEFICTHGQVTSESCLSEATTPMLNMRRENYPKLPQQPQSASASLSLLSQLNRITEKSHGQVINQSKPTKSSPQRAQESDEQQECELINTPPSPGARSPPNRDDRVNTPDGNLTTNDTVKIENVLSLKQECVDHETSSNEEKLCLVAYSPQERFQSKYNGTDERTGGKLLNCNFNQQDNTDLHEREAIDHQSLAAYFSTRREDEMTVDRAYPPSVYLPQIDNPRERKGQFKASTLSDRLVYSMSDNISRDRVVDSNLKSHYSQPKKEKPKKEYRCDYCGKMFGRQQHLKRHILTHTGERPYPCQYCEKRFRRSEHLKHHLTNHEQTVGSDLQPKLKKPRRNPRANDAYTFSKMMLTNYSHPGNNVEFSNTSAAPVILPSMFSEASHTGLSSTNAVSDLSSNTADNERGPVGSLALTNGLTEEQLNGHQESPTCDHESSATALNLSLIVPKVEPQQALSTNEAADNVDENPEDLRLCESEGNSPRSEVISPNSESPINGHVSTFDENDVSRGMIRVDGNDERQTFTSDLKRLIASLET